MLGKVGEHGIEYPYEPLGKDTGQEKILYRQRYPYDHMTCRQCLENKKITYSYWWQDRDTQPFLFLHRPAKTGPFCNLKCWRAYETGREGA